MSGFSTLSQQNDGGDKEDEFQLYEDSTHQPEATISPEEQEEE